jgi:uncharacterized membrane protein YhfC
MLKGLSTTFLAIIIIMTMFLLCIICAGLIIYVRPKEDNTLAITAVFGFGATTTATLVTLLKQQESLEQSRQNAEKLKEAQETLWSQSHGHKRELMEKIEETKGEVIETKIVAKEGKEASNRAEHEANNMNVKLESLGIRTTGIENRETEKN